MTTGPVGASGVDGEHTAVARLPRTSSVARVRARGVMHCARCQSLDTVSLDKVDARSHTCFRCRACGHIFSPAGL